MITREDVQKALPANLKSSATQALADALNTISNDPIVADNIRNNFVSFTSVLKEGKFTTEQYMNAVTYVSYKLMNYTNQEAYLRTFPRRHEELIAAGRTKQEISSYVSAYHKGKLVNLIMEQALVPMWVLNQNYFQEAIITQVDIMRNSSSDKVRSDAANSLLTHLQKPKDAAPLVSIDIKDTGMEALKEQLTLLARAQREAIEDGTSAREIAGIPLMKRIEAVDESD